MRGIALAMLPGIAVLAALPLLAPSGAHTAAAQEANLWSSSEVQGWRVSALRIRGLPEDLAQDLRAGLALSGRA